MKVLAIPDLHIPFQHIDAFDFLKAVKAKYKPNRVICLGDEVDFHGINMHDHSPDGLSAGLELKAAQQDLRKLYQIFPKVKVCTSNHTSLPYRRAFKFGLPNELLRSYREFLKAPVGWRWAEQHEVDGVLYEHGDPFTGQNAALKSAEQNMQSTVIGHVHSFAGIQYSANSRHLIFGFNVGCLINKDAYAFEYAKKIKRKPILGCGIITDGIPTFIPMILNPDGRWTGQL